LAPFTEGRHDALMQALGVRSLDRYDALVARLEEDGQHVPYSRRGSLDVVFDEHGARRLAEDSRALTAEGVAHTLYNNGAAGRFAPAIDRDVRSVLEIPAHGAVAVPDLVTALWRAAERRGAQIATATATRIVAGSTAIRVDIITGSSSPRTAHRAATADTAARADRLGSGLLPGAVG
jgi:hypothetical protein